MLDGVRQQSETSTARRQQGDTARDSVRMAEVSDTHDRTKIATLKVLYLLMITAAVFAVPAVIVGSTQWLAIVGLLVLQILILLACRIGTRDIIRPVSRLKWLFVFLIAVYTLLPGEDWSSDAPPLAWQIPVGDWSVPVNLAGLEQAGRMCLQIVTMLLASSVVRLTGTGRDLVEGLKSFRLPGLFVYSLDHTLELLSGAEPRRSDRGGKGFGAANDEGGSGARGSQGGFLALLRRLLRGDVAGFVQEIRGDVARAGEQITGEQGDKLSARMAHDVATVSGIALTMATLKVFKLLPGIPFASGHKVILLFPLYILASRLTYSRWGATAVGSVMGVIGFLQGDGRFGILEILKNVAPGVVIDLAEPWVRRLPSWALGYCLLGFAAAVARTTTEFAVVAMLGSRAEIYLFPMAKLVPNLIAGFLSGFTTMVVLRAFDRAMPRHQDSRAGADSPILEAWGGAAEGSFRPREADAPVPMPPVHPTQGE